MKFRLGSEYFKNKQQHQKSANFENNVNGLRTERFKKNKVFI